jgi:chromosome partitioning protein
MDELMIHETENSVSTETLTKAHVRAVVKKRPTVIVYAANKGGVGKTRLALLSANCLGKSGMEVLFMDFDFNNSASFYYTFDMNEKAVEEANTKTVFDALSREENTLTDYAVRTTHEGVSLIASSRQMADLRSVNERRLSRMMPLIEDRYDFVIIDCQPSYDNITLNALNAADIIIIPVLKDTDSYNAADFLVKKIAVETDKKDKWFVIINGYNKRYEEAKGGIQRDYIDMYTSRFRMMPKETWFPWTTDMNDLKDRRISLS